MVTRALQLCVSFTLALSALACARPETVVHVSAPNEARWEVQDVDGDHVCSLPCNVELDEHESVIVARADGRKFFFVRQAELGAGEFSASVRIRREDTRGTLAAHVFAAALSGAASVLEKSENRNHVAAGVFLSGMADATRAASDAARAKHEELWVERTDAP